MEWGNAHPPADEKQVVGIIISIFYKIGYGESVAQGSADPYTRIPFICRKFPGTIADGGINKVQLIISVVENAYGSWEDPGIIVQINVDELTG